MGIEVGRPSYEEAVKAGLLIHRHDFGSVALSLYQRIIDDEYDLIEPVVKNLVHAGGAAGLDYDDSAGLAEHDLEALFDVDPVIACVFMARLWSSLGYGMHQESDAINLNLYDCKDPRLLTYLEREAEREVDPTIRKWLNECIQDKKAEQQSRSLTP